jgi:hypothetical protein
MSEPTYTVILSESERTLLSRALGLFVTKLTNAPIFVEAPSGGTQQARAVLSPPSPPAAAPANSPKPPIEQRARWARDRKGNAIAPREYEIVEVHLSKAERKDLDDGKPRMKVAWPAATKGFVDANCFDDQLFPWLAAATKSAEKTTLYIVHSGKYTNVVGVRA